MAKPGGTGRLNVGGVYHRGKCHRGRGQDRGWERLVSCLGKLGSYIYGGEKP